MSKLRPGEVKHNRTCFFRVNHQLDRCLRHQIRSIFDLTTFWLLVRLHGLIRGFLLGVSSPLRVRAPPLLYFLTWHSPVLWYEGWWLLPSFIQKKKKVVHVEYPIAISLTNKRLHKPLELHVKLSSFYVIDSSLKENNELAIRASFHVIDSSLKENNKLALHASFHHLVLLRLPSAPHLSQACRPTKMGDCQWSMHWI